MKAVEKVWEARGGFDHPESPAFDPERNVFYVSNMAGDGYPPDEHGKGFLSVVGPAGEVIEPRWVGGLHEVKNIAIRDGLIYGADVGRLVAIDIEAGKLVDEYQAAGSQYLDGIAIRENGDVYVGDLATNTIWRLDSTRDLFEPWLVNEMLDQPDGLVAEPDRLVVGGFGTFGPFGLRRTGSMMGHLTAVDYDTHEVTSLGDGAPIGNIDGVKPDGHGGYFLADYVNGKLIHVDPDGMPHTLTDVNPGVSDIEYVPSMDLIALAMMSDDIISAYRIYDI